MGHGVSQLEEIVRSCGNNQSELVAQLMGLLKDDRKFPDDSEMKKRTSQTFPLWEQLTSINVEVPSVKYGSRTRSVILVDWNNQLDFYEETMVDGDPQAPWKATHIRQNI